MHEQEINNTDVVDINHGQSSRWELVLVYPGGPHIKSLRKRMWQKSCMHRGRYIVNEIQAQEGGNSCEMDDLLFLFDNNSIFKRKNQIFLLHIHQTTREQKKRKGACFL